MLSDINNLTRLNKTQVKPAADMLERAFQDDPLFIIFFPNTVERENKLAHFLILWFVTPFHMVKSTRHLPIWKELQFGFLPRKLICHLGKC